MGVSVEKNGEWLVEIGVLVAVERSQPNLCHTKKYSTFTVQTFLAVAIRYALSIRTPLQAVGSCCTTRFRRRCTQNAQPCPLLLVPVGEPPLPCVLSLSCLAPIASLARTFDSFLFLHSQVSFYFLPAVKGGQHFGAPLISSFQAVRVLLMSKQR